jgi:hypothetical protein
VTGAGIPAMDLYSDGMTIGVSLLKPLFIIRHHLPASPFFALVTAMGVLRLRRPLVIAMTVAVAMLNLPENYSTIVRYHSRIGMGWSILSRGMRSPEIGYLSSR